MGKRLCFCVLAGLVVLGIAGCAAGDSRYTAEAPAGFFTGLWHGFICVVAFVVGLFHDGVEIYERTNSGGWYDFGFLLGAAGFLGGGARSGSRKKEKEKKQKKGRTIRIEFGAGDELGEEIEAKIKRGIRDWVDEAESADRDEWAEIAKKIEEKIKRELRDWAEDRRKD